MELQQLLNQIAQRITEEGTHSESARLRSLAAAVSGRAPGTAAALVDWGGSEVARARAFGLAAGVAIHHLDRGEQVILAVALADTTSSNLAA